MSPSILFGSVLVIGAVGVLGYVVLRKAWRQMLCADQHLARDRGGQRFLTKEALLPAGVGAYLAALGMLLLDKGPVAYITNVPGTLLVGLGVLAIGVFIGNGFKGTRPGTALLGLALQTPVILLLAVAAAIAAALTVFAVLLAMVGFLLYGVLSALGAMSAGRPVVARGPGPIEQLLDQHAKKRKDLERQEQMRRAQENMRELEQHWRRKD